MNKKRTARYIKIFIGLLMVLTFIFTPQLNVTAAKGDFTPPTAPKYLATSSISQSSVILKWSASYDKKGVAGYLIYRNSEYIASTNITSFTVSGLAASTTYNFYVKARDYSGNISASSNVITITTLPETTTPPTVPPAETKIISGYYASWAAYSGYTPLNIPASKLTNVNYAFAKIGDDLKIAIGDPSIDISNFTKLSELKKSYPNLRTSISVGGWEWSDKFSDAALTDASRTAFADSAVAFMKQYNFDGIDIDWEYPVSGGMSINTRRPEDKTNFTLLMAKLREKLNTQGTVDSRKYYLSFAGGSSSSYITNTELTKLCGYVDFATIMTYDLHGPWDTYSDFNAPLYTPSEASPQYKISVNSVIKSWINAGFPSSKIVLGVPFYGYVYNGVLNTNNGLYSLYSSGSSVTYDKVVSDYLSAPGFVKYTHSEAMVPWLSNGNVFLTYDDATSIASKANFIKTNGLAGASVWELSQNKNDVLLDALVNNMK